MSIPRDHHYLPQWYLERWAVNGKVTRFTRPAGPNGALHRARKSPRGIAYERDLYRLTDVDDPIESQALELHFFQHIDSRAAVALAKAEEGVRGSADDRIALSQFLISLLHRSPSRLKEMQAELIDNPDAPYTGLSEDALRSLAKAHANRLLAELVDSPESVRLMGKFKVYVIRPELGTRRFITGDRPITASRQLITQDAFLAMPISPEALMILCHDWQIAHSFRTQKPDALVYGINSAVVEQSQEVVLATDHRERAMIDRLFLKTQPGTVKDAVGLIRRKSPFVDLRPRVREFSRHDKRGMLYLGR